MAPMDAGSASSTLNATVPAHEVRWWIGYFGIFDGPTTPGLRLDGLLVVLDLSAVYHSSALGVLMACATAWLQSSVRAQHRNRIIVVVDEAWAILSNLGVTRWLQSSWK